MPDGNMCGDCHVYFKTRIAAEAVAVVYIIKRNGLLTCAVKDRPLKPIDPAIESCKQGHQLLKCFDIKQPACPIE